VSTYRSLYELLIGGPFRGSEADLARTLGVSRSSVRQVVDRVRTAEHVAEAGWTIPYVRPGVADNEWRIVDADTLAHEPSMQEARRIRVGRMLDSTRRNIGQATLALEGVDGRSREARYWRQTIKMLGGVESHLEMIAELGG